MASRSLLETCGIAAGALSKQIWGLNDRDLLKGLHREAIKCRSAQEFEAILHQVSPHADS